MSRRGLFPAVVGFAVLVGACGGRAPSSTEAPLVAALSGCASAAGERVARVEFRASEAAPAAAEGLIPGLVLRAYDYSVRGVDRVTHVGGYPTPPGAVNILPSSGTGADVQDAPPPAATIPLPPGPAHLTFTSVLMSLPAEVSLRAQTISALVGMSAATPLGRVTVRDVRQGPDSLALVLEHEWTPGLASTGFLPKGTLASSLGTADARVEGGVSYVIGRGTEQTVSFPRPIPRGHAAVVLVLGEWGLLYSGRTSLDVPADACAEAGA